MHERAAACEVECRAATVADRAREIAAVEMQRIVTACRAGQDEVEAKKTRERTSASEHRVCDVNDVRRASIGPAKPGRSQLASAQQKHSHVESLRVKVSMAVPGIAASGAKMLR